MIELGKEYLLPIKGTEEFIDLLFYHLNFHCYVVVEVKVKEFRSRDIGQIGRYIGIVDDIVKTESNSKTIGLIICKEKKTATTIPKNQRPHILTVPTTAESHSLFIVC